MAKIYTKGTWTDEVLSGTEAYEIVKSGGGAITNVSELADAAINLTTSVAVAGTALDAAKMNNIETGIDALDTQINAGHNIPNVAPGTAGNLLTSDGTDWISQASAAAGSFPCYTRLSLASGNPNPTTDLTAQTSVYVMPYGGNTVPLWDGTKFTAQAFSELTAALNATYQTATNVYDVYMFDDSGTIRAGFGVAWTSAASRGTGAGTAETETVNGVRVNKNSMTVRNGASSYTVAAKYGTVIGKIYPSTNGQLNYTATRCEIANEYNAMKKTLIATISTSSWAYTTATWRAPNANTTVGEGRVVFVCNGGCPVVASYSCYTYHSTSGGTMAATGIGIDVTNSNSAQNFGAWVDSNGMAVGCKYSGNIAEGGHFINSLEYSTATGTMTWTGSTHNPAANPALIVEIEA